VQTDPVQIGLPPSPLPTGYWDGPVEASNREWYAISGDWLQLHYNAQWNIGTSFNPYSTAPNTAHLLWKNQMIMGGLVGGEWNGVSYEGAFKAAPLIIMNGKVYWNMPGNEFRCYDLYTGEMLWKQTGYIRVGQRIRITETLGLSDYSAANPTAYLWDVSTTTWKRFDPITGNLLSSLTNALAPSEYGSLSGLSWIDGSPVVFIRQTAGWNTTVPNQLARNFLIRWDLTQVKNNDWQTGVVWNVSISTPGNPGPGDGRGSNQLYTVYPMSNVGIISATSGENRFAAFDLETGQMLWNKTVDYIDMGSVQGYESYGPFIQFAPESMTIYAYDIDTGNKLWDCKVGEYPWGSDLHMPSAAYAYGNMYVDSYDGHVYAINLKTGKITWTSDYAGDTSETPFGTWAFTHGPIVADGKIYAGQSEHSPTQPHIRGNQLCCIDAFTGKFLWKIDGANDTLRYFTWILYQR
jgi:outer membrane protein assembly factor BamB